jgi:Zn-dependent protease
MLFFLGQFDLPVFIAFIVVAFFAFAYHELGHALVADYLGDMTPRRHGRITLNPLPHISWLGMVMLILIGFGWAVTPINPNALRGNPRTSHAIVALAGPAMNLLMAVLFAIPLRLATMGVIDLPVLFTGGSSDDWLEWLSVLCYLGVRLNLFLIAFNLLPIPPLDGFWVLRGVVPLEMAHRLDGLMQYGMLIFLVVIFLLPRIGLNVFPMINNFVTTGFRFLVGGPF